MEIEGIEFKNVSVAGLTSDDDNGIVTAIVSVTGIVDNVRDIIEPGAYEKTLAARKPKGVWHHSWEKAVAKTLDVKELLPGDPGLPPELPNGDPWPPQAGAVQVKMQFNLDGERGKQAYSDVKFFADEQEWSIGYNVPTGGAAVEQKSGIRRIKTLDWYEYSPVLFGAMSSARTRVGVKDAQLAFKSLGDTQFARKETPQDAETGVGIAEEEQDELAEDLDELLDAEDFDLPEEEEEKSISNLLAKNNKLDPVKIRTAIKALKEVLDDMDDEEDDEGEYDEEDDEKKEAPLAFLELKAMEYDSLSACFSDWNLNERSLQMAAKVFDAALKGDDEDAVNSATDGVLTALEDLSGEDESGEKADAIALAGVTLRQLLQNTEDYKSSEAKAAYLENMAEEELRELDTFLETVPGEKSLKVAVDNEAGARAVLTGYSKGYGSPLAKKTKPKPKRKGISDDRREKDASKGEAMPDGSFPIENEKMLKDAIQAVGRAKDIDAAKAHIKKRAKAMGMEDMLPDSWQEKSLIPLSEFEEIGIDVKSLLGS